MVTLGNKERKRRKGSIFFVSLHILSSERRRKSHSVTAIFMGMANMPYIAFNLMQMGFPCFLYHQSVAS